MKGKWQPPSQKVPLLGCAHDPGHFTKCGAITTEIAVEDLDKLSIQCTTYLVSTKIVTPIIDFFRHFDTSHFPTLKILFDFFIQNII